MMGYRFVRMTPFQAHVITGWRYEAPYSFYDLYPGDEDMLLNQELNYHAVFDGDGEATDRLAGFACFGEDAQVIGGVYGDDALDIGFNMAPDRTGRGQGAAFVAAVCDFAWGGLWGGPLRLSVATFNERAITVYRRLGFRTIDWFIGTTRHGAASFVAMARPRSATAKASHLRA